MHVRRPHYRIAVCAFLLCSLGPGTLRSQNSRDSPGNLAELEKRASKGHVHEEIELADAYMRGRGVSQDSSKAAYWYEQAAKSGDPGAEHQIGYLYSAGLGVSKDPVRAAHWYQLAAASGDALARVNLGVLYLNGRGVDKDPVRAKELFKQAVEQGEGKGAAYLGVLAFNGIGGPADKVAAEKWFELGVKLHDPIAAYELALFYLQHDDHPHDPGQIAHLLRRSTEKGYVPAKYALGAFLLNHPALADSQDEPKGLLEEASALGDWRATFQLGELARGGSAAGGDPRKSLYYYELAALQGGPHAQDAVQIMSQLVARNLSAQEEAEATQQAKTSFEQHRLSFMFVPSPDGAVPSLRNISTTGPGDTPPAPKK